MKTGPLLVARADRAVDTGVTMVTVGVSIAAATPIEAELTTGVEACMASISKIKKIAIEVQEK